MLQLVFHREGAAIFYTGISHPGGVGANACARSRVEIPRGPLERVRLPQAQVEAWGYEGLKSANGAEVLVYEVGYFSPGRATFVMFGAIDPQMYARLRPVFTRFIQATKVG